MACSDARSDQACAFPETAVVALLIIRRVTWTLSLFGRGALALHRREAPFAPRGLPARGPAPHSGQNRNAEKQSALMRSHIPKIGRNAPVTLRYSDD